MNAPGMPYTLLFPTGQGEPGQAQAAGIGGGLMDRKGGAPAPGAPVNGFTCVIQMEDLAATKEAILARGGTTALDHRGARVSGGCLTSMIHAATSPAPSNRREATPEAGTRHRSRS